MQRLTRENFSHVFDRHRPAVLTVTPGETFLVETEDSRSGQCRTPETATAEYLLALRAKGPYYGNPVTGPVYIEGASPGDTLAVRIHEVQCDTLGYMGYWPSIYHLQDWLSEPVTHFVKIRDGFVWFDLPTAAGVHSLKIPVQPMIGCIGTAPDLEVLSGGRASRHGGNLDTPEVAAGSTVYLPVGVEGGLLYLGDCHPYQGDGEVSGCEMRADVVLSVEVLKDGSMADQQFPRVETAENLVTVGAGCPAELAQWQAIREMMRWLCQRHGWKREDARSFLAMVGDLRPGQLQSGDYTMRMIVPKSYLPQ
jgi:acetamidase/formamidase